MNTVTPLDPANPQLVRPWLTAPQLCTRYQISRTTLWRWSKLKGFPAPVRLGRIVRWDADDIEVFLTHQAGLQKVSRHD